jgi:hypothetical protein
LFEKPGFSRDHGMEKDSLDGCVSLSMLARLCHGEQSKNLLEAIAVPQGASSDPSTMRGR